MKLDFEQRQEAIKLEEWVVDCPDLAAAHIVALRDRLAQYERDLFDERTFQDRSQDTEWLRRGFLQRGAEIERLKDGIRALAQKIEAESERHQKSWRNGASPHHEGRADQAADDAGRLRALLREDNPPRPE